MLVLRLMLILAAISVAVTMGVFFLTRDRRYLRFSWQIIKFTGVLLLIAVAVLAAGRIILI